jgi:hypothetical protein
MGRQTETNRHLGCRLVVAGEDVVDVECELEQNVSDKILFA